MSNAEITTTARRVAREHNQHLTQAHSGGLLAFDEEGKGGEWYSGNSWPDAPIVYPIKDHRVTVREVQEWLDDRAVQ